MDELLKKYKTFDDDELEVKRDDLEAQIAALREEFMEIGKVLDVRRQVADLPEPNELDAQIAALQAKKELLTAVKK